MFDLRKLVKQVRYNEIKTINFNDEIIPDYRKNPQRYIISLEDIHDPEKIDEWSGIIVLSNNIFVTSANDDIYLWDANIGKCVNILHNDTNIKHLLLLSNDRFISCHKDNTVKFWLPYDGSYMCETLFKDISEINCLTKLSDNLIVTCSDDNYIRVWDIDNKQMIFHLANESSNKIKMIIADYDYNIVTIDDENNVTFWNIDESCKRQIIKLEFPLCSLAIDDSGNIYCGDWFGRIIEISPYSLTIDDAGNFNWDDGFRRITGISPSYSYLVTERFKISNSYIYTIKILPDCELLVNSTFDVMCILDQSSNSITQSLSIENKCGDATIEVLSDGRIVVGGSYGLLMILQFPLRQLTISDLYSLFDALEKNKSVSTLNIEKIRIDSIHSYNFLTLNLKNKRSDLTIISNTKLDTNS